MTALLLRLEVHRKELAPCQHVDVKLSRESSNMGW